MSSSPEIIKVHLQSSVMKCTEKNYLSYLHQILIGVSFKYRKKNLAL